MREKAACATLNRTPSAYGGAAPASDHLPIARRSARANDHAAKTLLFEVPFARAGAQKLWAGTVAIHPNAKTGAHHHGALESVIYVVRGRARISCS